MPLPTFTPHAPINASNAKQDKIDLFIDLGSIRLGDYPGREPEDIRGIYQAVLARFSGPARGEDTEQMIRTGYCSRLFGRRRPLQIITGERSGIGNGALFAGELHLTTNSPAMEIQLEFRGYLNPTRYVAHQWPSSVAEGQSRFGNEEQSRESLFRHNENADGRGQNEFSLDGKDNWIPDKGRFSSFTSAWGDRLREYMDAIRSMLEVEVRRVCECINSSGNPVAWHPSAEMEWSGSDTSLQRVETYWEFKHDAPLQLVGSLEAELRAYCSSEMVTRRFRGREERDGQLRLGTEENCLFLDAEVAPGIRLVIYAKTNRRVRFEVRHFMPEQSHRRGLPQRTTGAAGACERIASVSADAVEVLNRFFAFLRARVDFVTFSYSPLTLLFECAACAERAAYGDAVLNMLLSQGSVTRLPALTTTIRAMERAQILQRVNNEQGIASAAFVVTPQYQQALEVLRRLGTENPITGIIRRRRIRTPQS